MKPPDTTGRQPLCFIGAGRAGGSLAVLLAAAGWPVAAVWSRQAGRARTVCKRISEVSVFRPQRPRRLEDAALGSLVILAVPDDVLPTAVRRLQVARRPPPGAVALHLSGAVAPEVLAPLKEQGVFIGSVHPLAVLPAGRPSAAILEGAGFAVDGDPAGRRMARRLAKVLKGRPFLLKPEGRAAYHLAASLVANDSVALFQTALDMAQAAGIPATTARRSLAHLLKVTAQGLQDVEPARALTGPVARGDIETLRQHMGAARLSGHRTHRLHKELSRILVEMCQRAGRLEPATVRRLSRILGPAKAKGSHGSR